MQVVGGILTLNLSATSASRHYTQGERLRDQIVFRTVYKVAPVKYRKLYAYTWKCVKRRSLDNTKNFLNTIERSNTFFLPMSRPLGLGLHCLYP